MALRQLGEPRGLVDRVADHGVLVALGRADVAGHRLAGRDPDPDVDVVELGAHALAQLAPGGERGARGVVVVQRRAEDHQRGVALELVDRAAVLGGHLDDDGEEPVEQLDDLLRGPVGGQLRRADHVDEEHGDVAHLAAERQALLERLARDVLADLAPEQVAQALALGAGPRPSG